MNERPLFNEYPLRGVLEQQGQKLAQRVSQLPPDALLSDDLQPIAQELYDEFKVNAIELDEAGTSVEQLEVKVDVRGDFDRAIIDPSRPVLIDGVRVRYYVPYRGDEMLWRCQPSSFTTVWPRAADVGDNEVVFEYDRADRSVSSTKPQFDESLALVKRYLEWSAEEVRPFNTALAQRIGSAISARRERLQQGRGEVASLGYKVRASNPPSRPAPSVTPIPAKRRRKGSRDRPESVEYDVALSLAGEDRGYVDQVAEDLRAKGVRVFYDRFEEVKLWGRDLGEHFARVYGDASRFIVLFVSEHYAAKAWPTYEGRQALARAIRDHQDVVILPVRFDDTEVPGLTDARHYLDARKLSPAQLVSLIVEKMEVESAD